MKKLKYIILRGVILNGIILGLIIAYILKLLLPELASIQSTLIVIGALAIAGVLRSNFQYNNLVN